MGLIFAWFIFSIVVGAIGSSRKIGFFGGFILSLILSPLIGLICVLVSKSLSAEQYEKRMLNQMQQLTGTTDRNLAKELSELDNRLERGELNDYDYKLLKGELLRKYQ